jgi:hypothetical protein
MYIYKQTINAMKTLGLKMVTLFFLMVGGITAMGQYDRQEVPGDYFSLEGALQLFKQSASPEEFERLLNTPNSKVNNLDLNGDGEIDYIRVINRNEGNVHVFILQAVLSATDRQDVAVISLEKLSNGKAVLQITGDADVYGIETIIEPTEEVRVMAGTSTSRTVVNVWAWPAVQYVYSPYYTVWVSPWHWHFRPVWWISWSPITYYEYYSYWQPYRRYYSHCYTHRVVYAQHIYHPHRTSSPVYYKRHHTQIVNYRSRHNDNHNHGRGHGVDHNKRNHYTDERTGRDRYDAGRNGRDNNTTQHTQVARRTNMSEHKIERPTMNSRTPQEHRPGVERTPNVYRSERSEPGNTNRSEVRTKPTVSEHRPEVRTKPSVSERSSQPRNERSVVNTNRGSQQREVRSVDRSGDKGRSSGGGSEKRSNGSGRGKK